MQMSFMTHRADRNSYTGLDIDDFTVWNFIKYTTILLVPMGLVAYCNYDADPSKLRYKMPKVVENFDAYLSI